MQAIAVDAGTSVVKAVRFDAGGPAAVARRPVAVTSGVGGVSEQDPEVVWRAVAEVIAEVATSEVELLSVTAQGDGCWLIGGDGAPVGDALLWSDGRAAPLVEAWYRDGTAARARQVNAALTFPGSPAALLAWLAEHQPERLRAAETMTSCSGWLHHRLTGSRQLEWSDASHPFASLHTPQYQQEALAAFGLTPYRRLLPEVVHSASSVVPLAPDVAATLRLRAGIPVVQAPYDVPSSALGSGCTDPGDAFAILGTALVSGTLQGADSDPVATETIAFGIGETLLGLHPSLAGSGLLTWGAELLGVDDAAAVVALAAGSDGGVDVPLVLPYLSPAGERAPFQDPTASGAILNLRYATTRADLARGFVDALALALRESLDADGSAPPVNLCGGGATSDLWCQSVADALNRPVRRQAGLEAGARGAWLAGRLAVGELVLGALREAAELPGATLFAPSADAARFDALDPRWRAARGALGMGARR